MHELTLPPMLAPVPGRVHSPDLSPCRRGRLGLALIDLAIFNLVPREQTGEVDRELFFDSLQPVHHLGCIHRCRLPRRMWAYQGGSQAIQYVGLSLAVVFWAVFLVPLLFLAVHFSDDKVLPSAVYNDLGDVRRTNGGGAGDVQGLFVCSILPVVSFLMLGLIIAALVTGFSLGVWFSFLAVAPACGSILYDTSNVLHHFRTDMHVAAAPEVRSCSIAYLFYYVLLIMMQTQSNRN